MSGYPAICKGRIRRPTRPLAGAAPAWKPAGGGRAALTHALPPRGYSRPRPPAPHRANEERRDHVSKWICASCDYLYDPKFAFLAHGAPPGATLGELPEDWCCPECGAAKGYFLLLKEPGVGGEVAAGRFRPARQSTSASLRGAA